MQRAWQTPHGARPNRKGPGFAWETCRLGASQPPGRSLELRSNARPRGMTVPPQGGQNSAYRSGCHQLSSFQDLLLISQKIKGPATKKDYAQSAELYREVLTQAPAAYANLSMSRSRFFDQWTFIVVGVILLLILLACFAFVLRGRTGPHRGSCTGLKEEFPPR